MADTKNLADLLRSNGYDGEGTNDFISTLPKSIKRRVQALKKLQLEGIVFIYTSFHFLCGRVVFVR